MKKSLLTIASFSVILSANLYATDISVKITNLTKGISFTPILVSAHNDASKTFTLGAAASSEIKIMAEGGDISGLESQIGTQAQYHNNPAG
jgi:hypothetical protein